VYDATVVYVENRFCIHCFSFIFYAHVFVHAYTRMKEKEIEHHTLSYKFLIVGGVILEKTVGNHAFSEAWRIWRSHIRSQVLFLYFSLFELRLVVM